LDDDLQIPMRAPIQIQAPPGLPPLRDSAVRVACAAGLWASGCLVTAAGLPATGAIARRCALMQGAGYATAGALSMYFNPELRDSVENGIDQVCKSVEPFQHAVSAVGSSITDHLGLSKHGPRCEDVSTSASHTDSFNASSSCSSTESLPSCAQRFTKGANSLAEHCKDLQNRTKPIRDTVQVSLSQVPACFGKRRPSAQNQLIEAGTKVKIVDLKSAVNLNGKIGEVLSFDVKTGRYRVKIFSMKIYSAACHASSSSSSSSHDDAKLIKVNNLHVLPNTSCSQPIVESQFL